MQCKHFLRVKIRKSHHIQLEIIETVREVEEEGYMYFIIFGRDRMNEYKMNVMYRKEYLIRAWFELQSKRNSRSKRKAINSWVVALMRYRAGILSWLKHKLQEIYRRTRKLKSMNQELDPTSNM